MKMTIEEHHKLGTDLLAMDREIMRIKSMIGEHYGRSSIKYVTRWRDKGGVDDLRKARHYLDKLIELEDNSA